MQSIILLSTATCPIFLLIAVPFGLTITITVLQLYMFTWTFDAFFDNIAYCLVEHVVDVCGLFRAGFGEAHLDMGKGTSWVLANFWASETLTWRLATMSSLLPTRYMITLV